MSSKGNVALSIYNSKLFSGYFGLLDLKKRFSVLKFRFERKIDRKEIDVSIPLTEVKDFKDKLDAYIVIPVFGKSDHLVDCLESIKKSVGITPYVLIIDNGIPEGIAKVVSEHEVVEQYIKNNENNGFGEACNQGLAQIKNEFAFILNSDVMVFPDSLRKLLDTLVANPKAGICSSVLINPSGRYEEMGRVLNSQGDALPLFGTRKFEKENHKGVLSVPHVSYACIALRKKAFDLTNAFDPIFWPAYSEDVDISIQMFDKGYAVLVDLSSIVIHLQGSSSSQLDKLEEIKAKNTKALLKKHKNYFEKIDDTTDYLRYEYKLNSAWCANRNSYLVVSTNPNIDEEDLEKLLEIEHDELLIRFIACVCVDPQTLKPIDFNENAVNFFQNHSIKFFSPSKGDLRNWIRPLICCFNEIICDCQHCENLDIDEFKILRFAQPNAKIRCESIEHI